MPGAILFIIISGILLFFLPFILNFSLSKTRGKNVVLMLFLTIIFSYLITLILAFLPVVDEEKQTTISTKSLMLCLVIIFAIPGIFLVIFLGSPPEATTSGLPSDKDHIRFTTMDKKQAETYCDECHDSQGVAPLPEGHPPKSRCLFCHKQ